VRTVLECRSVVSPLVGHRRWANGAAGVTQFVLAVTVALIVRFVVEALRWVLDSPADNDLWWAVVPAVGASLAIVVIARSRTSAATADAYVYGVQRGSLGGRGFWSKWVALLCGVGVGVPLGYEGPMVYFGGAAGSVAAKWLPVHVRSAAVACAAAAVAMVIGAPVAAALFASEVVRRGLPLRRDLGPLTSGVLAAWLVLRAFDGSGGIIGVAPRVNTGAVAVAAIVIGLSCGLIGRVVAASIVSAKRRHLRASTRVCFVAAVLLVAVPAGRAFAGSWIFVGSGQRLVSWARGAPFGWIMVASAVFAVVVVTMVAGGVVGGLFLPLVSLGGAIALALTRSWLSGVPATVAVATGGCAMLAAGYGTPLTAVALAVSQLGFGSAGFSAGVAVMVATVASDGVTVSLHRR
jgi:H+/Cl- antiporter ClcA